MVHLNTRSQLRSGSRQLAVLRAGCLWLLCACTYSVDAKEKQAADAAVRVNAAKVNAAKVNAAPAQSAAPDARNQDTETSAAVDSDASDPSGDAAQAPSVPASDDEYAQAAPTRAGAPSDGGVDSSTNSSTAAADSTPDGDAAADEYEAAQDEAAATIYEICETPRGLTDESYCLHVLTAENAPEPLTQECAECLCRRGECADYSVDCVCTGEHCSTAQGCEADACADACLP